MSKAFGLFSQTKEQPPKFCRDCQHYAAAFEDQKARCHRPRKPTFDLVTGEKRHLVYYAESERSGLWEDDYGRCGVQGRFWEAKE